MLALLDLLHFELGFRHVAVLVGGGDRALGIEATKAALTRVGRFVAIAVTIVLTIAVLQVFLGNAGLA